MPRTIRPHPNLAALFARQDGVATVDQLVAHGYSAWAVHRRVRLGVWQRPLPGVIVNHNGPLNRRQMLVTSYLWAGEGSAIDGADACVWHGFTPPTMDPHRVHLVAPASRGLRSRDFVVVRRTIGEIQIGARAIVPFVDAATAVIVAGRNTGSSRAAISVLSRALQAGIVSVESLREARNALGDKYCGPVDRALVAVGVGLRSPAESDARAVILDTAGLPEPLWNQWIQLDDGGVEMCPDALWPDAGLVHEVNGKRWHAWDRTFEDMQARHDRMTAMGLIALHNAPARLRTAPADVGREILRTYRLYAGRGMPAGVRLVDPPAWAVNRAEGCL